MKNILFVCAGNICRSPLAEGIVRARLAGAGLDLRVDSAGTQDYHVGDPPDPRAIAVAAANGIDISALRARQVTARDFEEFDAVLLADRENLRCLRARHPGLARQPELLLEWCGMADPREVPDPYYGDAAGFERVFRLLECAADGLLQRLRNGP